MAIQYNKANNEFQVDYQAPFGGLDTTAYASAIGPNNFAATAGMYVENNVLKPVTMAQVTASFTPAGGEKIYGWVPFQNNLSGAVGGYPNGYLITSHNVYEVLITGVASFSFVQLAAYTPLIPASTVGFNYLMINDVQSTGRPIIYWTMDLWTEIWQFQFGVGASQLTGYCGGGVLGLLDNQFLNLGGYSALDGYKPNRISWSASGKYGNFKPYDVGTGTGDYDAGFNDLPSTSDILTAFAAIGTVGYIFRLQGITQMNPTGNGVQPFSFNHLWASELGIGSPYYGSVSQYGSVVAFITDNGVYSLGLSGLTELGQSARDAIFKAINKSNQQDVAVTLFFTSIIQGQLIPYVLDSPDLMFVLGINDTNVFANTSYKFYGISLSDGRVLDFGRLITTDLSQAQNPLLELSYTQPLIGNPVGGTSQISRQTKLLAVVNTQTAVRFYKLDFINSAQAVVTFRKEQLKFGFVPTIQKVGFLAALVDTSTNGTISISVDGGLTFNAAYPDIQVVAGVGNPGNGVIDNVYSDGIQSLERPQLVIKLTNVQVAEAWYQGILADYELI